MVMSRCCESGSTTCCVTGAPVGFQAASGTAPVSQINVPLGCTTRKQATDRSVVATSSFSELEAPHISDVKSAAINGKQSLDSPAGLGEDGRAWQVWRPE